MSDTIVSSIVGSPSCGTASASQLDSFRNLVSGATNRDNRVVSKICPDFVRLGIIKRLSGIPAEAFRFVDHLAFAEVHGDDAFVCLAGYEQPLSFEVHAEVVHITFGW